jgi:predicted nuclease of predicted toxin-antitoxin system
VKILLDQNISFRVVKLLSDTFDKVDHVKLLNLTDASDKEIWDYALINGYTIMTFDSDFIDLATLKGTPPKIIWLRFGNSTNLKIANKLIINAASVRSFIENEDSGIGVLEID